MLPCSRHIESRHRAQWASQVEIAAYAQAYSTPITVLSAQQGKAFTFVPPAAKHPMIYVLHRNDHFQRVIHIPVAAYKVGERAEAHFTEIPAFPASGEVILPNIGSAVALWLGKMPLGIRKLDYHGPQAFNLATVDMPPNAHAAATYCASQSQCLAENFKPPTIPSLGGVSTLAAGGPKSIGPFIPDPRPKAKPPPAHVYDGAGWSLSGWAADVYCCKGIGCIHGSPGPEYPCCAAEFNQPSECQTSSDEECSLPYYSPKSPPATDHQSSTACPVPKLDIFRGVPGYTILSNLRKRVHAFTDLAKAVCNLADALRYYSAFHNCVEEESELWVTNARFWNLKCSYSQAEIDDLQCNAAQAARATYVAWDEPSYWDASSGFCPTNGHNLLPGFTHYEQFQVLANLIQMRAHHAIKHSPATHDVHELRLVTVHASIFQRFAWHYFANADINEAFLDSLLQETMVVSARAVFSAGAEGDEDTPLPRPKKTRKRRPEEAQQGPARRPHASDVPEQPFHPTVPKGHPPESTIKQEADVEMEHDTPPASRAAQDAPAPPLQAPSAEKPPYVSLHSSDAAPRASAQAPPSTIEAAPLPPKTECKDEAPNIPVRLQKAYPGKQPPPQTQTAASSSNTQPKAYKEMPRKAIPESLKPNPSTDLPMPGFLTPQNPPPPKARPRQRTPTPNPTPRAGYPDPSSATPADYEKAAAIERDVGEYVPHDAGLLCTKHGLNEQHIPSELRYTEDSQRILPAISVFMSQSFFENPRQEKPRRGFGSTLCQGQHNSDTDWPTGYYCLFCRMKNKINANTWGKPFSTLAALFSWSGIQLYPIAYLCLLRKQYHWHRAMIRTHILTHSAFVGDKAVKDETRHPHASLPRIWNIFTTKGECDAHCRLPPPPGLDDPRRDSARGASSSNAPLFRPTAPIPDLNRHTNSPPPEYTKSGLKLSERDWHRQEFPDDPDSSGSSMEGDCNEFSFIALLRTNRFAESRSTIDIPLKFATKPVSPSPNTKQHALTIPTGATVREIYDAGYRLFRAVPMRAARKLTHDSNFQLTSRTAGYMCAVPRTSGTFATQFQEYPPATPLSPSPPPADAESEEEDDDTDSAKTAKSAHTPPDEPTSPAGPQLDDEEGYPVVATKPIPELIVLDENQVDPAARPDGGSISDNAPSEVVLPFNPLAKSDKPSSASQPSEGSYCYHPSSACTQALGQVHAPLDGGSAGDTAIATSNAPWPVLGISNAFYYHTLSLLSGSHFTALSWSKAFCWYHLVHLFRTFFDNLTALTKVIIDACCCLCLPPPCFKMMFFAWMCSGMVNLIINVFDDGPVQLDHYSANCIGTLCYGQQRIRHLGKRDDPNFFGNFGFEFRIEAGVIREFNIDYPATEVAFVFDLRGYLGFILFPDPHHDVLFRQINDIAPYDVDRICGIWELPKEFVNASRNLDRHFTSVLCCDNSVPRDCPLALALNEPTGDITNFNQLRAIWYPTTVVSETLLRRPLRMPRFWFGCYLWPWVNSWVIPPYEHSIVQDGFYIRFCPCDRIGRTINRADIMRDRMLNHALSAIPPSLPSVLTTPAPSTYHADSERDERREDDASSISSADTFRTPPTHEESSQTVTDDHESTITDATHESISAGGAINHDVEPLSNKSDIESSVQIADGDESDTPLPNPSPATKTSLLPLATVSNETGKHSHLSPEARQKKRQRASRRRVVLADDAIHTDSTEEFIAKRPHITRSQALKGLCSHRLDRWLEQQDRGTSTSSVQTSVVTPATTIAWTPILITSPDLLPQDRNPISPRRLFEDCAADENPHFSLMHDQILATPSEHNDGLHEDHRSQCQDVIQTRKAQCSGGMNSCFALPSIEEGQTLVGPPEPYSALHTKKGFIVFCFSEHGFIGNRTLPARQPLKQSLSSLAADWAFWPKTMVLSFNIFNPPVAAQIIADRQGLHAAILLISFHIFPTSGTLTLFSPEVGTLHFDDWSAIRAMRTCWLPPDMVSELCCRWVCDVPRFLKGKYVFVSIGDSDLLPACNLPMFFGPHITISLKSQVGTSIEASSPLFHTDVGPASNDPTFRQWTKKDVHIDPQKLLPDTALWFSAGALPCSLGNFIDKILSAGGKRVQLHTAAPTFNFYTHVLLIGEEGYRGDVQIPGFASDNLIITHVLCKFRPRFSFIHPISHAVPIPGELLSESCLNSNCTRTCVCLVSMKFQQFSSCVLVNDTPSHVDEHNTRPPSFRAVWLPGTVLSELQIKNACAIPDTINGASTILFCNDEPIQDKELKVIENGSYIFYVATTMRMQAPAINDARSAKTPRVLISIQSFCEQLTRARFHFEPGFIYFPIGDAWRSVGRNLWLFAVMICLHFSCSDEPALNADILHDMLGTRQFCKLISCSHYLARFVRLRAAKDPWWFFEFIRVQERASGNSHMQDDCMFRIPQTHTALVHLHANIAVPDPNSPNELLIPFYHPCYQHTFHGILLHAGSHDDSTCSYQHTDSNDVTITGRDFMCRLAGGIPDRAAYSVPRRTVIYFPIEQLRHPVLPYMWLFCFLGSNHFDQVPNY